MDLFEIEPYRLAGKHEGQWALTITRVNRFGIDEQPFHGGPIFDNAQDALRYGDNWVASRRGQVRKGTIR